MATIYRIQDKEGRGPFRPGFSHQWIDEDRAEWPETYMHQFGADILKNIPEQRHAGCGFFSVDQLKKWFTPVELDRLLLLGYSAVKLDSSTVIARSKEQLVFHRKKPLWIDAIKIDV